MARTRFITIVSPEAAAAAFNSFSNLSLAQDSLRKAEEEVAYATPSTPSSPRLECAEEVIAAFEAVTPATVFIANNSIGWREVKGGGKRERGFIPAFAMPQDDWDWWGFVTLDLSRPEWREITFVSATSGSSLRATHHRDGDIRLEFIPSSSRPEYRGSYFAAWKEAAGYPHSDSGDEVVYSTSSSGYAVA